MFRGVLKSEIKQLGVHIQWTYMLAHIIGCRPEAVGCRTSGKMAVNYPTASSLWPTALFVYVRSHGFTETLPITRATSLRVNGGNEEPCLLSTGPASWAR